MDDQFWMQVALSLATTAGQLDEVPIGALIVKDDRIIGTGFNLKELTKNPTDHAEIRAIHQACEYLQAWRLEGCTLYSTLEPCLMCSGALHQARISKVVYAAPDPKAGGLGSLYNISNDQRLNHTFEVIQGIMEAKAASLLKDFFKRKRK